MQDSARWTRHVVMLADLAKGGYIHSYDIRRNGESVGQLTVTAQTRKSEAIVTWFHGDEEFSSQAEFRRAVEETIGKRGQ